MKKNILLFCFSCFFCLNTHATMIESGVIVNDLSSFSLNTLGSHTKLEKNLWQKSNPDELFQLVDKIGTTPVSPASRKILITLLTQDTTGFELSPSQTENTFLNKRLQALIRLGAFKEAIELLSLVPVQNLNQDLLLIKTNLFLALAKFKEAEETINDLAPSVETDQAQINLFLEKEEKNKAILSYEIYRENKTSSDSIFSSLAENVLLELEEKIDETTQFNLSHVFLLSRLKNHPLKLENQTEGFRKIFINLPAASINDRLFYAEKISLSAEERETIYKLPLLDLNIDKNHLRRAEIYHKIKTETDPYAKAEWLRTFIKISFQDQLGLYMAPLIEKELNSVLPQKEYKDLAFYATQIYILSNNLEKAYEWYKLLETETDDKYQKERLLLISSMQKLGAGIPFETSSLLTHFCSDLKNEYCADFWKNASKDFYEIATTPTPKTPPLMIFDYAKSENSSKKGENLIRALLDLNDKNIQDKYSLLFFIKQNYPKDIYLPIELEGTLYQ